MQEGKPFTLMGSWKSEVINENESKTDLVED